MQHFEYRVVPAPAKGRKAAGVKGPEARFAHSLEHAINDMAADGWEYLRAEILPSEERQGLTSSHTVYRSVLVFRRPKDAEAVPAGPADGDRPDAARAADVIEDAKSVAEEAAEDVPKGQDPQMPGPPPDPPSRRPDEPERGPG